MILPAFILGDYTYYMHIEPYSRVQYRWSSEGLNNKAVTQIDIDGAVVGVKPNVYFKL